MDGRLTNPQQKGFLVLCQDKNGCLIANKAKLILKENLAKSTSTAKVKSIAKLTSAKFIAGLTSTINFHCGTYFGI